MSSVYDAAGGSDGLHRLADAWHQRVMHSGNGPHEEKDQRAIVCFDRAMDDVGLSADGNDNAVSFRCRSRPR